MIRALLQQNPRVEALARKLISIYPYSKRLGPGFWHWYAFMQESETWTTAQLQEYQFQSLRKLLKQLQDRKDPSAERLATSDIDRITNLDSLQKTLPTQTRKTFAKALLENPSRENHRKDWVKVVTSGTTGSALQFHHHKEDQAREWAAISHQWYLVGYDPARSIRAEFRGLTAPGSLYCDYPDKNMVRAEHLEKMADIIRSRKATFYHGYPSALYLLAQCVQRSGIVFPQPEAILLASEMVYDFQIDQIQAAFPNARLMAHYGCAERTVLGAWCEHRRVYHTLPQYSIVEADTTTGEIQGTNLYNDINPFIRYRMTDAAGEIETAACPACRRPYTPIIAKLDGREEDYLYSPETGWIAPAIVTYPLKQLHHISELQFVQDVPDKLLLNYIPSQDSTKHQVMEELSSIESGLKRLVGQAVTLRTVPVDAIPRGATGKFKWIVSRLDPSLIGTEIKTSK